MSWIAYASSPAAIHAVDVTDHLAEGVASLLCDRVYIESLGDPDCSSATERPR